MAETYLNTEDGRLYIGAAAIAEGMERPFSEMVPLAELIQDPDFTLPEDFEKPRRHHWNKEECLIAGQWMVRLLNESDVDNSTGVPRITEEPIERLSLLGLGPSSPTITEHCGPLWAFAEAIGARGGKPSDKYRNWTINQFASYAASLAQSIGRKPTDKDYESRYQQLKGPGPHLINSGVGGIRKLNDMIGYPDVNSMDDDDLVMWGVKVMQANDGKHPTVSMIRHLSKIKRGPSDHTVRRIGMPKFKQLVIEKADELDREQAEHDAHLLAEYDKMAEAGALLTPEETDMQTILGTTAKYLVALKCLPQLDQKVLASMAHLAPTRFLEALRGKSPRLTAGFIETTAVSLDVFDYIWPMDDWRQYLKVSDDELGYKRKPKR